MKEIQKIQVLILPGSFRILTIQNRDNQEASVQLEREQKKQIEKEYAVDLYSECMDKKTKKQKNY